MAAQLYTRRARHRPPRNTRPQRAVPVGELAQVQKMLRRAALTQPMTLRLIRDPSKDHVTFGTLFVDDVMECLTLEDEIRERPGVPVPEWKVPGKTAIPAGRYSMRLTMSRRFCCVLPLLVDVPGFSGVRIHSGNAIDDTDGCIVVGRRTSGTKIAESRLAFGRGGVKLSPESASSAVVLGSRLAQPPQSLQADR